MHLRSWLLAIVACLSLAAGLAWYKYAEISAAIAAGAAYPEPVESVELFVVEAIRHQPVTTVSGYVVAPRAIDLTSELPGRVVEIGFAPGARVSAGQALVRLDSREEQAQLDAATAEVDLARIDLDRRQRLISTGAGTEDDRDRARATYDAAVANQQRLAAIVDKLTLRAPFEARAGLHELEIGQLLEANTPITRLVGVTEDIWVDFSLPQQEATLAVGAAVTFAQADDPRRRSARVIARDAFVNERSRNVRYRAVVDNDDGALAPGMILSLAVPLGEAREATRVPMAAVRRDAFGANVYVLEAAESGAGAPERARRQAVRLGPQAGESVVVLAGLEVGQRIAANGAFKLRDGVLVRAVRAVAQPTGDS